MGKSGPERMAALRERRERQGLRQVLVWVPNGMQQRVRDYAARLVKEAAPVKCPKCGGEQHCPCENCRKWNQHRVTWLWLADGERIACGHCGFTAHVDWWHDEGCRQILRAPDPTTSSPE